MEMRILVVEDELKMASLVRRGLSEEGHAVDVAASGVHLLDTTLRRGEPGPVPQPDLPTIPGREVAGTVDRVGADVDPTGLEIRIKNHIFRVLGVMTPKGASSSGQ